MITMDPLTDIPPSLDSENFRIAWAEWVEFRMSLKKVKRWDLMFKKQLEWLSSMPIPTAIAIIDQSIRQGWQGLFEIKTPPRPYHGSNQGLPTCLQSNPIEERTSKFTKMKELELVEAQLKEIRGRASESALETIFEPQDIEPRRLLIARKKQLKAELGYTK